MECAETSIPEKGIFIVCVFKGSFWRPPLTTRRQFGSLRNYVTISLPQKRKFYCDIKFFIYEITSRLLRDKFFYLRVEFFLLARELFLVPSDCPSGRIRIFSDRIRLRVRSHQNFFWSHQTKFRSQVRIILIWVRLLTPSHQLAGYNGASCLQRAEHIKSRPRTLDEMRGLRMVL